MDGNLVAKLAAKEIRLRSPPAPSLDSQSTRMRTIERLEFPKHMHFYHNYLSTINGCAFAGKHKLKLTFVRDWRQQGFTYAAGAMAFVGAFLAFVMEPLVGRMVTPFFGGAVHVWAVSLMVFQALLLAGYLYAHLVAPRIGGWHLLVVLLPVIQLPLSFRSVVAPQAPIAALTFGLFSQISLPFAVLSTTAVVAQVWWYRASTPEHLSEPFFLYGVSNFGAMVGLLGYPFLIEPFLGVTAQRWIWSVVYLAYFGTTILTWLMVRPLRETRGVIRATGADSVAWTVVGKWLALSTASSALLVATTNIIAYEVGSISLIWVLPLALYLGSFIVAFARRPIKFTRVLDAYTIEIAIFALIFGRVFAFSIWAIVGLLVLFFALCLIANRCLYLLRPPSSQLTKFYLTIAVGGLIGGMLVSLVAPVAFATVAEFPIATIAVVAASWRLSRILRWWNLPIFKGGIRFTLLTLLMIVCFGFLVVADWVTGHSQHFRNFYGVKTIRDVEANNGVPTYRILANGRTIHGAQFLDAARRDEPLTYYYNGGPLQQAASIRAHPSRSAVIGLGTGASAMWFDAGERLDFYEIDPGVETLARSHFTYLRDAVARIDVIVGDARLNFAAPDRHAGPYDFILVDAFSGDSVPTHLLTQEALEIYLSHLAEDGVIVFHVTNRYYDLRPIIKAIASRRDLAGAVTVKFDPSNVIHSGSYVVVLTRQPRRLAPLLADKRWSALGRDDGLPAMTPWTDDYINILAALRIWARVR